MTEPVAYGLLRAAERSAVHMELRDAYTPDDPDWLDWQAGRRFDPEDRWASWSGLVRATVARGVSVRRLRLVSEPVTDYVRFEYDVTAAHNLAAGEHGEDDGRVGGGQGGPQQQGGAPLEPEQGVRGHGQPGRGDQGAHDAEEEAARCREPGDERQALEQGAVPRLGGLELLDPRLLPRACASRQHHRESRARQEGQRCDEDALPALWQQDEENGGRRGQDEGRNGGETGTGTVLLKRQHEAASPG